MQKNLWLTYPRDREMELDKSIMSEETKIICVACPKGCRLRINREGETIVVSEQGCKRGEQYAVQELTDPRRMVATTVRLQSNSHPLLPVYTSAPIPKGKILPLLSLLREINLQVPVKMGQVVLKDALGTGINVLASRDVD
jgi:CxxC motif-containing protein